MDSQEAKKIQIAGILFQALAIGLSFVGIITTWIISSLQFHQTKLQFIEINRPIIGFETNPTLAEKNQKLRIVLLNGGEPRLGIR